MDCVNAVSLMLKLLLLVLLLLPLFNLKNIYTCNNVFGNDSPTNSIVDRIV